MPQPRKINLLPPELKHWLEEELVTRGFADYEALAEALNFRLEEEGYELRIGKSAIHNFGTEHAEFIKYQAEASSWAESWMQDNGLDSEAQRHNVLFQMITTLAFKVMKKQMTKEGDQIDPKELHLIGKMMKDIMASSGIREKLKSDERARIRLEERQRATEAAADAAVSAASEAGLSDEQAAFLRNRVLGLAA